VSQGSILGPILFLIFIDDLQDGISGAVLRFAKDIELFRPVVSQTDQIKLQKDVE